MTDRPDTVTSTQGDTISRVAYLHYGTSSGQVERILASNPKLCNQPPLLPAGIIIVLPPAEAQDRAAPSLNLWD